jgi:hypothetical protein
MCFMVHCSNMRPVSQKCNRTVNPMIMKKPIALLLAFGLAMSTRALPTYDNFSTYSTNSGANLLGGNTAPTGESWIIYTNCPASELDGNNVWITNYFVSNRDPMSFTLPANFPGPFVSGKDTSSNSVGVPFTSNGNSYGLGACLAFSSDIAGTAGQTIYASFFFDVPVLNPTTPTNVTIFNGNSSTYNSWFAGFVCNSNLPGPIAHQLTGPLNFERFVLRAVNNNAFNKLFWGTVGDGFDGESPFSGTGVNFLAQPLPAGAEMTQASIYFLVFSYEWGTNGTVGNDAERFWFNPVNTSFGAGTEPTPSYAKGTGFLPTNSLPLTDAAGFFFVTGPGTDNDGDRGVPSGGMVFNSLRIGTNWAYVTGGLQNTAAGSVTTGVGKTAVLNPPLASAGVPITAAAWANSSGPCTGGRYSVNATTGALTITGVQASDADTYTVTATTPIASENGFAAVTAQNSVPVTVLTSENASAIGSSQFTLSFTGPVGAGYRIWSTTSFTPNKPVIGSPGWTQVTSGTYNSGVNSYTDTAATSHTKYYTITVP